MIGMGRPWPSLKSKETAAEENDKTKTVKTPILDKEARKSGETYAKLIKRNKYEGQAGKIIHDVILKVEVFAGSFFMEGTFGCIWDDIEDLRKSNKLRKHRTNKYKNRSIGTPSI